MSIKTKNKILIAGLIAGFIYTEYKKIYILFKMQKEIKNIKNFNSAMFSIIRIRNDYFNKTLQKILKKIKI